MLKAHQRLQQSRDIIHTYKHGRRYVAQHGVFFMYFKRGDLSPTRCSVVIGKKFSQKAVERNRIRRILRAAVQKEYQSLNVGYDIVVGYTKKEQMLSYKDACSDVVFFGKEKIQRTH